MEIKLVQKSVLEVWENDKLISQTIVESNLPLGTMHDSLMMQKGWTVDRMIAAQKQEQEIAEQQRQLSESCPEGECEVNVE